jgi:hypothetical protein
MPKTITIEMDDSNFTSKNTTNLVTYGISTCIAFIIYASFFDEDDHLIQARGLYHWSGFSFEQDNPEQTTQDVFSNFLDELREAFDLSYELEIEIGSLIFIGGEKAEWDNGELIVSGTESEVINLIKVVKDFDFTGSNFIKPKQISHNHFLTTGDEALTITVQSNHCFYTKISLGKENDYCEDNFPSSSPSFQHS